MTTTSNVLNPPIIIKEKISLPKSSVPKKFSFEKPKNTESKFISAFNFEEKINNIITKNILININFLVIYSPSLLKNLIKNQTLNEQKTYKYKLKIYRLESHYNLYLLYYLLENNLFQELQN